MVNRGGLMVDMNEETKKYEEGVKNLIEETAEPINYVCFTKDVCSPEDCRENGIDPLIDHCFNCGAEVVRSNIRLPTRVQVICHQCVKQEE